MTGFRRRPRAGPGGEIRRRQGICRAAAASSGRCATWPSSRHGWTAQGRTGPGSSSRYRTAATGSAATASSPTPGGPSAPGPPGEVAGMMEALATQGIKEVVLTGIDLAAYRDPAFEDGPERASRVPGAAPDPAEDPLKLGRPGLRGRPGPGDRRLRARSRKASTSPCRAARTGSSQRWAGRTPRLHTRRLSGSCKTSMPGHRHRHGHHGGLSR